MRVEAEDIEQWFAAAGRRETDLRRMDATIQQHAPDLERLFTAWSHGGPGLGYGTISYRTRSAPTPTTIPVLGLAIQKRHLSLYACVVVDGDYLAERYAARLGRVSCGKSCVRFTRYDNLDEAGLVPMLQEINERYRRGETLYGHA